MNSIRSLITVPVIILSLSITLPLAGQVRHSGTNLYGFGDSTASMGRGGTGVSDKTTDTFFINPASIAFAERFALSTNYGTLEGTFYNPAITVAVPTEYGVIGGNIRFLHIPDGTNLQSIYSITLGGAKDITSYWAVGMALNVVYGQSGSDDVYIGTVIGTSFYLKSLTSSSGFGIIRPSIGIAINAGVPLGDNWQYVNFNSLTLGYTFRFFENNFLSIGFYNDLSMVHGYTAFPVKLGLEFEIIRSIYVRGGTTLPSAYNYGDITAGIGYTFNHEQFLVSANYSLAYNEKTEFLHYLGLNFEYGELDRKAPETKIKLDHKYISPNNNGVQDTVTMEIEVIDQSKIKGWYLRIVDNSGNVVRDYKPVDRDILERITFTEFFQRLVQRKTSRYVPRFISWDGKNDQGEILPDGKYQYRFAAWDERDNLSLTDSGTIIIDTVAPDVTVTLPDRFFSPNNDGSKDMLVIQHQISMQPGDVWHGAILSPKGEKIRTYTWDTAPPRTLTWDGTDDQGNGAPEGLYSYTISCRDNAGNAVSQTVSEIVLTREFETADIYSSDNLISHENSEMIRFFPRLSSAQHLVSWSVSLRNNLNQEIKTFEGSDKIPSSLEYDLTDKNGKPLRDGTYTYQLVAKYQSGNKPSSFAKEFNVDSTPPSLSLRKDLNIFSPDGDNENDILTLFPSWKDSSGIRDWSVKILDPGGSVFKTFNGKGDLPESIIWDGLSDRQELVESATDYFAFIEATDNAGNRGVSEKLTIPVDVLVIVTERGLKMRVSNITFRINSAELTGTGTSILRRIRQILTRYDTYDVLIEGHTDDIGAEEYNLKLSEMRAQAVRDHLVANGITGDRLQFIGMGESTPLYPNTTVENRRKNRRVEFLLIKKGELQE